MPRTTVTRFCCCCGLEATVWSDSDHAWGEFRCAGCRDPWNRRPSASKTTATARRARRDYIIDRRATA